MNTELARSNMLKQQIRTWGILDQSILDLINTIPREQFVPRQYEQLAYADISIPLASGAFMPSPKEEAKILQVLQLTEQDKVLEVGAGSGYLTALMAKLARHVYSIGLSAQTIAPIRATLNTLGIDNVSLVAGTLGELPRTAPYDAIIINGSLPMVPHHIRSMLIEGGRIFAVVGNQPVMEATLFKHITGNQWQINKLFETVWPRLPGIKEIKQFTF